MGLAQNFKIIEILVDLFLLKKKDNCITFKKLVAGQLLYLPVIIFIHV